MERVDGPLLRTWLAECFLTATRDGAPPVDDAPAVDGTSFSSPDATCLAILAVPGDEVSFYLFEAPDEIAVRRAAATAGLPLDRIVECRVTTFNPRALARR